MSDRLLAAARERIAAAVSEAGGNEVSCVADVGADGVITRVEVVARGTVDAVLALPGVASKGQMLLHNHPSGNLEPSNADLDVAVRLHDAGVGFGIVDNAAGSLYVVVEVPHPRKSAPIDPMEVAHLLAPKGGVARALRLHEDRPS